MRFKMTGRSGSGPEGFVAQKMVAVSGMASDVRRMDYPIRGAHAVRSCIAGGAFLLAVSSASAQRFGPRQVDSLPSRAPNLVAPYGTDSLQFGELRLPTGAGPFPVAVVIHGGC